MYEVLEGNQTEVCAVLTSGTLETEVVVLVTSSDGTATGTHSLVSFSCKYNIHCLFFSQLTVTMMLLVSCLPLMPVQAETASTLLLWKTIPLKTMRLTLSHLPPQRTDQD